jgi:transcriptional antiterminator RfaH
MLTTLPWFVVYVNPSQENFAAAVLCCKGYDVFLPTYAARRRGSSDKVIAQRPLFPGYLFCRCGPEITGRIVTTPGVIRIVGAGKTPIPVSEEEVTSIRTLVSANVAVRPWRYLPAGTLVRIENGPLKGVQGILIAEGSRSRLVVSISILQRSTAVTLDSDTSITVMSLAGSKHHIPDQSPEESLLLLRMRGLCLD